jgi:hypothetical protein
MNPTKHKSFLEEVWRITNRGLTSFLFEISIDRRLEFSTTRTSPSNPSPSLALSQIDHPHHGTAKGTLNMLHDSLNVEGIDKFMYILPKSQSQIT